MGYTTTFKGTFKCTPALPAELADTLRRYADTRHYKRNDCEGFGKDGEMWADTYSDHKSFPLGKAPEGYNTPAGDCPGLWCHWVPTSDGTGIEWDGSEKFTKYAQWLRFIVERFLAPAGITLSGAVQWQGEEPSDAGTLTVADNIVQEQPDAGSEGWSDNEKRLMSSILPAQYPLDYPRQKMETANGCMESVYVIPEDELVDVIQELWPFSGCPAPDEPMVDLHSGMTMTLRDLKVIRFDRRNMIVSKDYLNTGGMAVDLVPPKVKDAMDKSSCIVQECKFAKEAQNG